ncbi:hypothetical protein M8J77_011648 [Diaphorina citri]|nr:hypothetical protein M8J77_011648 [Diaphorina citri]
MQLNKIRNLLTRSTESVCLKCSSRHFQNGFSPKHEIKCLDHLVAALTNNAIYFDSHILVLNKPYGLKRQHVLSKSPSFIKLNPAAASLDEYSLKDAIPALCEIYHTPQLTIVKCPDRYMSGITVLASSDKVAAKFDKCIRCARSEFLFPKYQAVCVGTPKVREKKHVLGIVMEERKDLNIKDRFNEKRMVFVNTWSKNEVKRADVSLLRLHHKVLSSTSDESASLIEVSSNWNRAHCVRTFLAAKLLTPVLGDHIFSARVKYVFDKPVLGDLWNFDHHMQYLPAKLKEKLKVRRKGEELTIPEHIHLSQLTLPGYYRDQQNLVLTCPISSSSAFQYALNTLELSCEEKAESGKGSENRGIAEVGFNINVAEAESIRDQSSV